MTVRFSRVLWVAACLVACSVALLGTQGRGKPGPGPTPGTATFDCSAFDPSRGLCASQALVAELTTGGPNEMEIRDTTGDAAASMFLSFNGQRPQDSPDRVDCSIAMGTCLWDWTQDPRSGDFIGFSLGTNVLDPTGSFELSGGLLGMAQGTSYKVRLNMTITVPETTGFWRFNFNPNTPSTGGGDLADVERTGSCSWQLSALGGQRAALSILVKDKGKQVTHHEGTYAMPFVLTFNAPNCQG